MAEATVRTAAIPINARKWDLSGSLAHSLANEILPNSRFIIERTEGTASRRTYVRLGSIDGTRV